MKNKILDTKEQNLFNDIALLIEQSKKQVVIQANSSVSILFWNVGYSINKFILQHKRAEYGKQIIVTLSRLLTKHYGRNFEEKNLRRMLQFVDQFDDLEIVVTLSRQLSWSHFLVLIPIKKKDSKLFYAQKTTEESWSVRVLRKQIEAKVYEQTLIANTQLPIKIKETHNLFKDPYLLNFLNLKDDYLEKNLEEAILIDLEKFILELGKGFTFVERQKRLIIDGDDYYLDLLFFHRKLRRLVVIELKIGKFKAQYKVQMELYLKWLNRNEKQEGEKDPIGLILCTESSKEQIELLEIHKEGIMVGEYWTELPSRNILEEKIHQAVIEAKERIERQKLI
jgi:predicted nuclease of restriction endonuclease-like (RecB) superfamily